MTAMERNGNPIAEDRFQGPIATERYQPVDQSHALSTSPLETHGLAPLGLVSVLTVGPTGQGARYEFADPIGGRHYQHLGGDQGTTEGVVV